MVIFQGHSHLMDSDYFSLTYVDVEGLVYLDEQLLLETAEAVGGEHILEVQSEHLEAAFATLPFVRDVSVQRRLPDRLYIEIVEYEPAVIIVDEGFWLADHRGEVFLRLDSSAPQGEFWQAPLLTGLTRGELKTDEGRAQMQLGLDAYAHYKAMGLEQHDPLSEIRVDALLGVSLVVGEAGTEVRLGSGRWRERLERFAAVRRSLSLHGIQPAYVLIDHESDLNRVAVGPRLQPQDEEVGFSAPE